MIETSKIHIGSKFFRYIDDSEEPEVIRIRKIDQSKKLVKYTDKDNNKLSMEIDSLINNYKMLSPDGVIVFGIVRVEDVPDVIVALTDSKNIKSNLPYAVCRQSIYNFFGITDKFHSVGVSVSRDTCPANIPFESVLTATEVKESRAVAVYLDDSLDNILSFIYSRKYNEALRLLKQKSEAAFKGKHIPGYTESLRELLESNSFMYDFRTCFGIKEVPYHIFESEEQLDPDNKTFLENELNCKIGQTYLIRYTREIDMKSIKRDHMLITSAYDKFKDIYILGYDVIE